jgi:hypothetical protein
LERGIVNKTLESPLVASVLNRLLRTLSRSLALYVEEVRPWGLAGHGPLWTAIERLAADNRMYSRRVAEAIIEHGGQPHPGPYPLEFAALNDVGLEFFLRAIIDHLKRDQRMIGQWSDELACAPADRALAEEACGNLCGHSELLEKLAAEL